MMPLLDIDTLTALRVELIEMDQRHELDEAILLVKKGKHYVMFSSCEPRSSMMDNLNQVIESYLGSMDVHRIATIPIPEEPNKEG